MKQFLIRHSPLHSMGITRIWDMPEKEFKATLVKVYELKIIPVSKKRKFWKRKD